MGSFPQQRLNRIGTSESGPLILDGAMGTELMRRGLALPLPVWSADANLTHPELVRSVHADYVLAGAKILTTNTFRTTPRTYLKAGYSETKARERANTSLCSAVDLAKDAAGSGKEILIAGSLAPLEDCYMPDQFPGSVTAAKEFGDLGRWLQEAGVDLLLIETMGQLEEIHSVLQVTAELDIPCWISFILQDGTHLLGGRELPEAIQIASDSSVQVILLNCNSLRCTGEGIRTLKRFWRGKWGVYPNLGTGNPEPEGTFASIVEMEDFQRHFHSYVEKGAQVLGACCGSTPDHIRGLAKILGPKRE